jgi:hypothetical protein
VLAGDETRPVRLGEDDLPLAQLGPGFPAPTRARAGFDQPENKVTSLGVSFRRVSITRWPPVETIRSNWRQGKSAEFALDQPGESDRRAVLEIAADDLYADRKDRRCRRQAMLSA